MLFVIDRVLLAGSLLLFFFFSAEDAALVFDDCFFFATEAKAEVLDIGKDASKEEMAPISAVLAAKSPKEKVPLPSKVKGFVKFVVAEPVGAENSNASRLFLFESFSFLILSTLLSLYTHDAQFQKYPGKGRFKNFFTLSIIELIFRRVQSLIEIMLASLVLATAVLLTSSRYCDGFLSSAVKQTTLVNLLNFNILQLSSLHQTL